MRFSHLMAAMLPAVLAREHPEATSASSAAPTSSVGPTTSAISTKGAATSLASATFAAKNDTVTAAAGAANNAGVGGTALSTITGGSGVGGSNCTVTDLEGVAASLSACSNILMSGVSILASSTLSVTIPSGAALLFADTMTVGSTFDSDYVPIVLAGTGAKVAGLAGAVIDGSGSDYWDGEGSNGGVDKPDYFIKIDGMSDSSFSDLTIQDWPIHLFKIEGTNLEMSNLLLDNSAGSVLDSDGDNIASNTDGFDLDDVNGLHVHDVTVHNQDDCVASSPART